MESTARAIIDGADAVVGWQAPTLKEVVFRRRYYSPHDRTYFYEYRREIHVADGGMEFEMYSLYTFRSSDGYPAFRSIPFKSGSSTANILPLAARRLLAV